MLVWKLNKIVKWFFIIIKGVCYFIKSGNVMNRWCDKKKIQMWLLFKIFNVILFDVKIQVEVFVVF